LSALPDVPQKALQKALQKSAAAVGLAWVLLGAGHATGSPETFTENDVRDDRSGAYALTGATLTLTPGTQLQDATLLIRNGKVVDAGQELVIPDGYFTVPMDGHFIYPGLLELHSGYGLPAPGKAKSRSFSEAEIITPQTPGAYNANDAIRSHYQAAQHFTADARQRKVLRARGFSTLLVHRHDGIARGTSALVTLAEKTDNEIMLDARASAHFSFNRGSSTQSFPVSAMGAVALLRQSQYDANWYAQDQGFVDLSLSAWLDNQSLPQFFEVSNWKELLRVHNIATEFDQQYVVKTGGDAYQRIDAVKRSGLPLIVPINFPAAFDVDDPLSTQMITLQDMKHWELAPTNPAILAQHGIAFAITSSGSGKDFWKNIRKAIDHGLSTEDALAALTTNPAAMIGKQESLGHLNKGAVASFLVTSGPIFDQKSHRLETWIQGERYPLSPQQALVNGNYTLNIAGSEYTMTISNLPGKPKASLNTVETVESEKDAEAEEDIDAIPVALTTGGGQLTLRFTVDNINHELYGWLLGDQWQGRSLSNPSLSWSAFRAVDEQSDTPPEDANDDDDAPGEVIYPFLAFGNDQLPKAENLLIKNATVWTLENDGIMPNTDVLVSDGKIRRIGKSLKPGKARVIDGTGKHLTPGLIDEHSHIALDAVNDIATNSSMVRMKDVVNSEDINIWRALAGGTTSAQLLHGSANPIGGQSAIIKMRWGSLPEDMLIDDADGFIKFALGENVKRSRNTRSVRYPQTRMGVEQVFEDWFTAAHAYAQSRDAWHKLSKRKQKSAPMPRRDLVLDAMVEVLDEQRFVTCHSYRQSEINMLMNVADRHGFRINTFTHILEGYKVADKMASHGAGGSTFSDNWAFKWEVRYAIPYNSALMSQAGVTVAVNSDSSEVIRRLNHEAAKAIKYGGMAEQDALKLVTLNPAKLLHLDHRIGSIKTGKDADLVVWNDHPLSVYTVPTMTIIDGAVYYDIDQSREKQRAVNVERQRLISKLRRAKSKGVATKKAVSAPEKQWQCDSETGFEYLNLEEAMR
jgi:imidazolonepropionase-like amidohydrolase